MTLASAVSFSFDWEVSIIIWLQQAMGSFGTAAASVFSAFGEEMVLVAVMTFVYLCYDKKLGEYIGEVMCTVLCWNPLVKNVVLRHRPYIDHSEVKCLKAVDKKADIYDIKAQGYSFPSAHSADAAAMYGTAAIGLKKRWAYAAAWILCLLVGISRFALGVHYPTDVLAGWLLGLCSILAVSLLRKYVKNQELRFLIIFLTALPGWFFCKTSDFYTGFGIMAGFFAAVSFEHRFVHFKNTRNPLRMILRPLGVVALFMGLNTLFKLPFSPAFLEEEVFAAYLVRAVRYAVAIFGSLGLFPLIFRIWDKKEKDRSGNL